MLKLLYLEYECGGIKRGEEICVVKFAFKMRKKIVRNSNRQIKMQLGWVNRSVL
jgi:hypothetical protein